MRKLTLLVLLALLIPGVAGAALNIDAPPQATAGENISIFATVTHNGALVLDPDIQLSIVPEQEIRHPNATVEYRLRMPAQDLMIQARTTVQDTAEKNVSIELDRSSARLQIEAPDVALAGEQVSINVNAYLDSVRILQPSSMQVTLGNQSIDAQITTENGTRYFSAMPARDATVMVNAEIDGQNVSATHTIAVKQPQVDVGLSITQNRAVAKLFIEDILVYAPTWDARAQLPNGSTVPLDVQVTNGVATIDLPSQYQQSVVVLDAVVDGRVVRRVFNLENAVARPTKQVRVGQPVTWSVQTRGTITLPQTASNVTAKYDNGTQRSVPISGTPLLALDAGAVNALSTQSVENKLSVQVPESASEITYQTEAPVKLVEQQGAKTKITISSVTHYTDILASHQLETPAARESITLLHVENGSKSRVNLTYIDANNDGLVEEIEWVVPHLSSQEYELSLAILNPIEYPLEGEQWTVYFNTTGVGNLTVTSPNATWEDFSGNGSQNEMRFDALTCANTSLASQLLVREAGVWYNYTSVENASVRPDAFRVADYSCDQTAAFANTMNIPGYAALEFEFANQNTTLTQFAYDPIGPNLSVSLVDPIANMTVNYHDLFNFTVNVSCRNSSCGDVNVSLDPDWWNALWLKRVPLTINASSISENLTDLPVLVVLNDSNVNYSLIQNAGEDLRFTDVNGTLLSHEIDDYDELGNSYVWVKVPRIEASNSSQFIYLYYANDAASDAQNASDVWSDSYEAVYHMREDPSGTAPQVRDSTANAYHGDTNGGMTAGDLVSSQVGDGYEFDGGNDWVEIGTQLSADITGSFTWEAWVDPTAGSQETIMAINTGGLGNKMMWFVRANTAGLWVDGSHHPTSTDIVSGGLRHVVVTLNNSDGNVRTYVDGVHEAGDDFTTSTRVVASDVFSIGQEWDAGPSDFFPGIIDEVRVSSAIRSDERIEAEYLSMSNQLISFGETQDSAKGLVSTVVGDTPFYTTDPNPYNASTDVCLSSMNPGDSCLLTWVVNATGPLETVHNFYAIAESTTLYNESLRINITIDDLSAPRVTGIQPAASSTQLGFTDLVINATVNDNFAVDTVLVNITLPDSSTVIQPMTSNGSLYQYTYSIPNDAGVYDINFIANDTRGNMNATESTNFTVDPSAFVNVSLVDPAMNTSVVQNRTFDFSVNVSCTIDDCGDVNVSLDPAQWWNTDWQYRRAITFNNSASSEELVNFTMYVGLDSSFNYNLTQSAGEDIRFTDENATVLDYEIEQFNESGNSTFWVRAPSIPTGDDNYTIYLYYGNDAASDAQDSVSAWDSDYVAVWHMANSAGTVVDSTGVNNGTISGASATSGIVGSGLDFNQGAADHVAMGAVDGYEGQTNVSFEAWFRTDLTNGDDMIIAKSGTYTPLFWRDNSASPSGRTNTFSLAVSSGSDDRINGESGALSDTGWHHLLVSFDGTNQEFRAYLDGVEDPFSPTPHSYSSFPTSTQDLYIGTWISNSGYEFDGIISDVRIVNSDRSADWAYASYNNIVGDIVTLGEQETVSKGLISTSVGDTPFYTTDPNPYTPADDSCLSGMLAGESCLVTWSVNTTGEIGTTFEFFAFTNTSTLRDDESEHIFLTIVDWPEPTLVSQTQSVLDRDNASVSIPDTTTLTVNASLTNLTVFFYANLTDPTVPGQSDILLGTNTSNSSGIAQLTIDPNSSYYAGNYTWWASNGASETNLTESFVVYGLLNATFNSSINPNLVYAIPDNLTIEAVLNTSTENTSELQTYYNTSLIAQLTLANGSQENLTLSTNSTVWNATRYLNSTDPAGEWNALLSASANYFLYAQQNRSFNVTFGSVLDVFDEQELDGIKTFAGLNATHYANWTNSLDAPISSGTCSLGLYDGSNKSMSYNASLGLWTAGNAYYLEGIASYNVTCEDSGYGSINASDNITVQSVVNLSSSYTSTSISAGVREVTLSVTNLQNYTEHNVSLLVSWPALSSFVADTNVSDSSYYSGVESGNVTRWNMSLPANTTYNITVNASYTGTIRTGVSTPTFANVLYE